MHPAERYLSELALLRRTDAGVVELSGYPALKTLLDEIGTKTRPKVRTVMSLRNLGAGLPDGGLFTANQFSRANVPEPRDPSRPHVAAIEVKGTAENLESTIASQQVRGYVARYGQVLVTNYRQFVLLVQQESGTSRADEFSLGDDEAAFWREAAGRPRAWADERGDRFVEFLTRVLRSRARLVEPADVAWMLASHARDAMEILGDRDLPGLATIRSSFEEALGISFEGDDGDHFFRSSLVQTLFYGIFSGWVLWSRTPAARTRDATFDWKDAGWSLRVPMISALFDQIATRRVLGELRLIPVLERTGEVLNRVDRGAFFQKFQEQDAVQYFYEPFLQAFDPELRKQLGVWYTPREVVQYMVARVDAALREELGLPLGLADPDVVVLDPCCGTGAFLVEVLRQIEATLRGQGGDALVASDLRRAVTERVFGFEILPAPFVVAHLQLGLLLQQLGAPLPDGSEVRVGVFLTNALTDWNPDAQHPDLPFRELAEERDRAGEVKQRRRILVILGNPPYNGFAGVTPSAEERELTEAYRTVRRAPVPQGQGLNDLYVRFFRMAERKIVEQTGRGIVCFISNYSWLDGLSFTGMREQYLREFDQIQIDCLNGDRYKTGKLTPEGDPDPSIFSTESNRAGIQVGTAITTLVRSSSHVGVQLISFRDFWGQQKRGQLAAEAKGEGVVHGYWSVDPSRQAGFAFRPLTALPAYATWPKLTEIFGVSFPGVKTSRDGFLIAIDRTILETRIAKYLDPTVSDEELRRDFPDLMESNDSYDSVTVRQDILRGGLSEGRIIRYCFRPFDVRWLFYMPEYGLLDRPREGYTALVSPFNPWLEARQRQPKDKFDRGTVTTVLADNFGNGLSHFFPLMRKAETVAQERFTSAEWTSNLTARSDAYARQQAVEAAMIFDHCTAVLHAPVFRRENAGALRLDWPRIPLPASREVLERSVSLGAELRQLLDPEIAVTDAPASGFPDRFRGLGVLTAAGGGSLDPLAGDLAVTAGWGIRGRGGVTMPSQGKFTEHGATVDVWLNDRAFWANIPVPVWEYTLGGYQVIKKWLSYREKALLGRDLTPEEARYVSEMVRRIAAILALGEALDASCEAVKSNLWEWAKG